MRGWALRWLGATACAAVVLLAAVGCGDKPKDDKAPPEKTDGMEISWTGSVSRTYECDLDLGVSAAKAALQKLNLRIAGESGAIFEKSLGAESADGTSISVNVTEVSKASTKISVKVGSVLGNKDAARRIHSEIEAEMAARRQTEHKWRGFSDFGVPAKPAPTIAKGDTP